MVGADRKGKFDQLVANIFKTTFKITPKQDLLFTFLSSRLMRVSKDDYLSQLRSTLLQFEREYRELAYVNLDEAIASVASAEKALSGTANPHLLLVGQSGVGRQTTLLLAVLSLKLDIIKLPTVRDMGVREFRK